MKTIKLYYGSIDLIINQLNDSLGGVISRDEDHIKLQIDNAIGRGSIKGITFSGGISYVDFDVTFNEDFCISLNTPDTSPIYFTYCTQGYITHKFADSTSNGKKIGQFQTGILTSKNRELNKLCFHKNVALKTVFIAVNTTGPNSTETYNLNYKLNKVFLADKGESYLYVGSYNLKIADLVKQLHAIKQKGIVRRLLSEGFIHMILGLEIQQHEDDTANKNTVMTTLTSRELKSIHNVSQYIDANSEKRMSIAYLCRLASLSSRKLQEGFKMMHNTTVIDYIRDVRFRKAEELLKNTDLNISEVVYSIGITSRSYFSKIFKEKYDCSPRQYKDQCKLVVRPS